MVKLQDFPIGEVVWSDCYCFSCDRSNWEVIMNKKEITIIEIETKCKRCGAESTHREDKKEKFK